MGWPLAVSAGLMDKSPRALFRALWALAAGHLLATLLVLLPFAFLLVLAEWQRSIQLGASLLVIGFGVYRLIGDAIRARWHEFRRRNWRSGHSPLPLLTARP